MSREEESRDQEEELTWSNLPRDVVGLITARLSSPELCMFRGVCKPWRRIVETSGYKPDLALAASANNVMISRFPILMKVHNDFCSFFNPMYNTSIYRVIPELVNATLFHAKGEWLLLGRTDHGKDDNTVIFFYNIDTRVRIDVPCFQRGFFSCPFHRMCFFSNPDSNDWSIVATDVGFDYIGTIKHGQLSWNFSRLIYSNRVALHSNPVVVVKGGLCYCLGKDGTLLSFDPTEITSPETRFEVVSKKPPPIQQNQPHVEIDECFLVPIEGEEDVVLTIFKHKFLKEEDEDHRDTFLTSVYEFNLVTSTWRKLDSLGNKMLFVARTGSLLLQVEDEEASTNMMMMVKNKIFYPNLLMGNGVFFSLATGSYHCFLLNHNSSPPYGRRGATMHSCLASNSAWIGPMPQSLFLSIQ